MRVEVDGRWYDDGELRSWDQAEDGSWSGIVTWRLKPGTLHIDRFTTERIRQVR